MESYTFYSNIISFLFYIYFFLNMNLLQMILS